MAKIEWCSHTYKVGIEMMESEWEKTFDHHNDITSSWYPFINGVSTRFSKTIASH